MIFEAVSEGRYNPGKTGSTRRRSEDETRYQAGGCMTYVIGLAILYLAYRFLLRPMLKDKHADDPVVMNDMPVRRAGKTVQRSRPSQFDHDNWEGTFWDVQSPRSISANLRIEYRDGAGSFTKRDIRLMRYGPWQGGALMFAYCHLRQASRTFRSDRVLKCVDLDTGEVIQDVANWLDASYQTSPDRAIEQIIETAWDAIRVLFYVGKADGRLSQSERSILREAIRGMSNHPAIDDRRLDSLIDSLDTPSLVAFKQAYGRLIKRDFALAEKLVDIAEAIVETENALSQPEQEALNYLKIRLGKARRLNA
jgi:hypothetical protein